MTTALPQAFEVPSAADDLAALVERHTGGHDGIHRTAIGPLQLVRLCAPTQTAGVVGPALCLVAQGRKQVALAGDVVDYDPGHFVLAAVDLPLIGRVTDASRRRPYLGLKLSIDPKQVAELVAEVPAGPTAGDRGLWAGRLDTHLADAVCRLLRLLDRPPTHRSMLAPMLVREVLFLLLMGDHGPRLRRITLGDGHGGLAAAFAALRQDFDRPLRVDDLARLAHRSPSAFHRQFKIVAGMAPHRYQQHLRLTEARRLMLTGGADVATAADRVGYASASQFGREYRRLFGESPRRDIDRMRSVDRGVTADWPVDPPLRPDPTESR